jgi:hypothetical protein
VVALQSRHPYSAREFFVAIVGELAATSLGGHLVASSTTRRDFLQRSAQAGALAGFAFLERLPTLSAQDVQAARNVAAVSADLEPLVRLIEDAPRERLIETVAERIRQGTSYGEIFGAATLAGVRGIRPRPVGFKFHAVLVMNSAHLASLASADRDRWLPLLWSLDNFKASQERNRIEGDWRMPALEDGQLPAAAHAGRRFREAMDNWQEEPADRAVAAWSRAAGANEIYEAFWRLGARDFRDIGHKAIFVANSYRALQTIGWRHAEPILRSLAYALLEHEGTNPAQRDADQDRPGRDNARRLTRIRADWQRGQASRDASVDLLATLRTASAGDASEAVVRQLNNQIDPASIWDALFLASGEWLMSQPGIVGLHCVTTMNALHFGYQTSSDDETRRFLMLQAAAFLPLFRQAMQARGRLQETRLDALEPLAPTARGPEAVAEVLADISRDKTAAARKTLAIVQTDPATARDVIAGARRLIFSRGNDSHDYKFSSAALEDYFHVSPALRPRFLASSVFWLRGSGGNETDLYRRTRAALG